MGLGHGSRTGMQKRLRNGGFAVLGILLLAVMQPERSAAAEPVRIANDGSLELAGRQLRCDNVRTRLDQRLPNLGVAAPRERLVVLNPALLRRYSDTVQLFVFHHECGHHRTGDSELAADCWAVGQGVRHSWLDSRGLGDVCRSFENAPETSTHPSGKRRCANIDRCFAAATTEVALERERGREQLTRLVASVTAAPVLVSGPKLVSGPRLVRVSDVR